MMVNIRELSQPVEMVINIRELDQSVGFMMVNITRTKSQPMRLEPPDGVDQPPFGMIVSLACRSEAFQMDGVTRVLNHNTLPSFWATLIGDSPSTIATVVSQHQYITCETHTIREGFVRHYERWHCETL